MPLQQLQFESDLFLDPGVRVTAHWALTAAWDPEAHQPSTQNIHYAAHSCIRH